MYIHTRKHRCRGKGELERHPHQFNKSLLRPKQIQSDGGADRGSSVGLSPWPSKLLLWAQIVQNCFGWPTNCKSTVLDTKGDKNEK